MFPRNYWSSSFSRCRTRGGLSNSAAYCFSISFYTIVVVITVVVASRHRRLFLLVFCIIPIFFSCDNRTAGSGRPTSQALPNSIISSKAASHLSLSRCYCCLTRLVFFKCYLIPAHMKIESFNTAAGNNRRRWGGHFVVSNEDVTAGIWKQEKCSEKRNRKKKVVADYYKREKKEREDLKWSR